MLWGELSMRGTRTRAVRAHAIWAIVLLVAGAAGPAGAANKNPHSCIAAASARSTTVSFVLYAGRGENLPMIGNWSLAPNAPMGDLTVTSTHQNVRGAEFTINAPRDVTAAEQIWFDGAERRGNDGFMCEGTTYVIFH
jgi:hypothetical protein